MLSLTILVPAILNGLLTGAVYGLVALGLTLIYGVLHIINFAHGALLTAAMFAAFFAHRLLGLDPYLAAVVLTPMFFVLGYCLQRFVIGPAAHGEDRNVLLVTLGLAVVIENMLLYAFGADTRTINLDYAFGIVDLGIAFLALHRVVGFGVVLAVTLLLWLVLSLTDTGKAIRAVAKATYYVNPHIGNAFVLVAFTIVVLGGMGSVTGALVAGLFVGVVESLCGFYLGESLGQIGIFVMFILVLLFRPSGLFGERA